MKLALDTVNERILAAAQRRSPEILVPSSFARLPRLVAVSKLKPISSIIEAYECGQRYFGENYIQELVEKSNSPVILEKCPEIKFHFIGHLQSNKVNKLLKVRNLHMVETVDSIKLADLIDKAIGKSLSEGGERLAQSSGDDDHETTGESEGQKQIVCHIRERLKVMLQINTSGEEQKNGIDPDEAPSLAEHIWNRCRRLELAGLMTIGRLDGWPAGDGPNKDFLRLYEARKVIADKLTIEPQRLELSMGMSGDFEEAITMGSTNVRVGTLIFGQRDPKPK